WWKKSPNPDSIYALKRQNDFFNTWFGAKVPKPSFATFVASVPKVWIELEQDLFLHCRNSLHEQIFVVWSVEPIIYVYGPPHMPVRLSVEQPLELRLTDPKVDADGGWTVTP